MIYATAHLMWMLFYCTRKSYVQPVYVFLSEWLFLRMVTMLTFESQVLIQYIYLIAFILISAATDDDICDCAPHVDARLLY